MNDKKLFQLSLSTIVKKVPQFMYSAVEVNFYLIDEGCTHAQVSLD